MNKKSAKIDQKMFSAIKTLLNGGATYKECADYMGVSVSTVGRIAMAESFEDYKGQMAAMHLEMKKKEEQKRMPAVKKAETQKPEPEPEPEPQVIEHRQSVTIQATHFMMQKLDEVIRQLTTMNAKVACIIDDLYGTKEGSK